jgi:hypothetical protein
MDSVLASNSKSQNGNKWTMRLYNGAYNHNGYLLQFLNPKQHVTDNVCHSNHDRMHVQQVFWDVMKNLKVYKSALVSSCRNATSLVLAYVLCFESKQQCVILYDSCPNSAYINQEFKMHVTSKPGVGLHCVFGIESKTCRHSFVRHLSETRPVFLSVLRFWFAEPKAVLTILCFVFASQTLSSTLCDSSLNCKWG